MAGHGADISWDLLRQIVQAWAGILVASLLGLAMYAGVVVAERIVVRWTPENQPS